MGTSVTDYPFTCRVILRTKPVFLIIIIHNPPTCLEKKKTSKKYAGVDKKVTHMLNGSMPQLCIQLDTDKTHTTSQTVEACGVSIQTGYSILGKYILSY
jgi:hypothetical protein